MSPAFTPNLLAVSVLVMLSVYSKRTGTDTGGAGRFGPFTVYGYCIVPYTVFVTKTQTIHHTVTLPDGTVGKRGSARRHYTHAVAAQKTAALEAENIVRGIAYARKQIAEHQAILAMVERGEVARDSRGAAYTYPGAELPETWRGYIADAEARITTLMATEGADGEWFVTGWQSRRDLAAKEAARWKKWGYRVQILEATEV